MAHDAVKNNTGGNNAAFPHIRKFLGYMFLFQLSEIPLAAVSDGVYVIARGVLYFFLGYLVIRAKNENRRLLLLIPGFILEYISVILLNFPLIKQFVGENVSFGFDFLELTVTTVDSIIVVIVICETFETLKNKPHAAIGHLVIALMAIQWLTNAFMAIYRLIQTTMHLLDHLPGSNLFYGIYYMISGVFITIKLLLYIFFLFISWKKLKKAAAA